MAVQFKSFEPKQGYEDLVLDVHTDRVEARDDKGQVVLDKDGLPKYDRDEGAPLTIREWPFTARSTQEEGELAKHPYLQESKPEVQATPSAVAFANQHGVDLQAAEIEGSGTDGRVTKEDVESFLAKDRGDS